MQEKPNYWAHLTAEVRYDKSISAVAKLIYAELTALTSVEGYAWASNGYFAELYDLSECQISRILKSLSDAGYIKIELTRNPDDKRVTLRKIWIVKGCESEIHCKNDKAEVRKNDKADLSKNDKVHLRKNRKDNITKNNTINITSDSDESAQKIFEEMDNLKEPKFTKNDYKDCMSVFTSCQNTLKDKGYKIDSTQYPYSLTNKTLKKWFTEYGVEATKKGIVNAMSFKWLIDREFKFTILFSDSIFPQCVSNSFSSNSNQRQSLVGSGFDNATQNNKDFTNDEGAW